MDTSNYYQTRRVGYGFLVGYDAALFVLADQAPDEH
jgi:hypothetical protein